MWVILREIIMLCFGMDSVWVSNALTINNSSELIQSLMKILSMHAFDSQKQVKSLMQKTARLKKKACTRL